MSRCQVWFDHSETRKDTLSMESSSNSRLGNLGGDGVGKIGKGDTAVLVDNANDSSDISIGEDAGSTWVLFSLDSSLLLVQLDDPVDSRPVYII